MLCEYRIFPDDTGIKGKRLSLFFKLIALQRQNFVNPLFHSVIVTNGTCGYCGYKLCTITCN